MNKPILSIGITSYKRIAELERCIRSIKTQYGDDIEILVSEDCSPLSKEIGERVEALKKECPYKLYFMPNEHNLGYDMNLGAIIKKSTGKYIFYMSDDDAMAPNVLDHIIPFIKNDNSYGVLYAPFVKTATNTMYRNRWKRDKEIPSSEESAANYVYDAILFSGLIFRRDFVKELDSSRFKNKNYFQVYMFLKMLYLHGGYFFEEPSVLCIEDGENAYGISESSGGNALLANRESIISNLEFNKTLFDVIRMFDEESQTKVFESFEKQYSLHSYSGMSIARAEGVKYFKKYWTMLKSLDIKLYPVAYAYYYLLLILGVKVSNLLVSIPKRIIK